MSYENLESSMTGDCDVCYNLLPVGYGYYSPQSIVESARKGKCKTCLLLYQGLRKFDATLYPDNASTDSSEVVNDIPFLFPWPENRFQAAEFYILHGM